MNVLTCTDINFVVPTGIMLYSLCKNNKNSELNIFIIVDNSVLPKQKQLIERQLSEFPNAKVNYVTINIDDIKNDLIIKAECFPVSIYYRLLLADYLPDSIDKVLYLDADIIVLKDLSDLWMSFVENKAVGGVVNQSNAQNYWERLDYPVEKGYFNSGVLLINVDYWRKCNASYLLIEYVKNNSEKLLNPDQDALNYVFQDQKFFIPERYNMQELFYSKSYKDVPCGNKEEIEKSLKDPSILHYTQFKPWFVESKHPLRSIYYEYKKQTIWKNNYQMELNHISSLRKIKKAIKDLLLNKHLYKKINTKS